MAVLPGVRPGQIASVRRFDGVELVRQNRASATWLRRAWSQKGTYWARFAMPGAGDSEAARSAGESGTSSGNTNDASAVTVTVAVSSGVGVTVAEITTVLVTPWVSVITTVMFTLSGVGVKVGIGLWVGVGGKVEVGVAVLPGGAVLVGTEVGLAVKVGGISRATSCTNRERARKLPIPRQ